MRDIKRQIQQEEESSVSGRVGVAERDTLESQEQVKAHNVK